MTQQLRNKLTGLMPDAQDPQQQNVMPPTWETHIVIPVVQNALGGVAFGGLWVTIAYTFGYSITDDLLTSAAIFGLSVAFAITIPRFFGDDLGLIWAAYKMGRASADAQISGLVSQLEQMRATVKEMRGTSQTTGGDMLAKIERAHADAQHLLGLAYGGMSIAREKVQPAMTQRPWERAINLLRAAGCVEGNGTLADRNLGVGLKRLEAYKIEDIQRANSGRDWRPKWFVEAKH
jgi:hypothetical protein